MNSYVSFPHLGLKFNISEVAFTIGGKEIYWYGLIISIGFLLAIICALKLADKYGMKTDTIIDIVLFGAPIGIICARLYYVIFQWDYYSQNPGEIIKIWNGGLAIYGGILSAIVVAIVYCRIKKENLMLLCDIGSIGLLIGQSVGRWGNFANQEAFGTNTNLPWGMTGDVIKRELYSLTLDGVNVDPNIPVHPTFLYESLWNAMFIAIYLLCFKKRKFDGQIFFSYLVSYGVGRFFIEGLRTDSLTAGGFRVSQLVSLGCATAGVALLIYNLRKPEKKLTLPADKKTQEI